MKLKHSGYTIYGKIKTGIETGNVNFHQAKMVCPIRKNVKISYNV